ncbi:SufS family cysteine desulfurase [Aerococcaceae bacterium DSM 111020]|nr:SufS family cysteine desulfurase [Aerococcaceae bacterium DSM 111020]
MSKLLNAKQLATIRDEFPVLQRTVHDQPLIYLDNAATSQKPKAMIEGMLDYYTYHNANSHRGVHQLALESTEAFEAVRGQIADWLQVQTNEIIFNSGTTEGINAIAFGLGLSVLEPGDKIFLTQLEHHANLVPWQEVAKLTGAEIVFMPVDPQTYVIDLQGVAKILDQSVKIVATHHVSNVIGVQQPINELSKIIREYTNAHIIIDGAQSVSHLKLNLKNLDIDAYCFSAHKMYGPTGLGIMYINERIHQDMAPFKYGGEMINQVDDFSSNYKVSPWKYEGGTQPIAEVVSFGKTLDYLSQLPMDELWEHEQALTDRLIHQLSAMDGVSIYQDISQETHGIVSYNIEAIHPHDAATAYDLEGIAIRAGHHCAQPLMRILNVPATLRASISFYNTVEEIDYFVQVTKRIKEFFEHGFRK